MAFAIELELLRGLYGSGSVEARHDWEWPPHAARLYSALVAAAGDSTVHDSALRWLESQPAPSIWASRAYEVGTTRESFVPLNQTVGGSSYGQHAARKAGALQVWRHVSPRAPVVRYVWSATPSQADAESLSVLVAEVPYLGRSSSPVEARVVDADAAVPPDVVEFVPGGPDDSRLVSLPRDGFLTELREMFEAGLPSHEVPRRVLRYGVERDLEAMVHGSPFDPELLVLPFAERRRVGAAFTMVVSAAVRKAMEAVLDGGPLVLRGARQGEERPQHQVLILGLPDVGHEHASGLCGGVAIVLPRDIEPVDRSAIYRAIDAIEHNGVTAGRLGVLRFETDGRAAVRMLDPGRWTTASRQWVTATPMTADRFVKVREAEAASEEVRRACGFAGLPDPEWIETSEMPLAIGAPTIRPNLRVRRQGDPVLPSFHARIRFAGPVEGPVVLGNLRRYGLGLMLPEPT